MSETFWVLFFISTGAHNHGTVTNFEHRFDSEEACRIVQRQIYEGEEWGGASGLAKVICVEVPAHGTNDRARE